MNISAELEEMFIEFLDKMESSIDASDNWNQTSSKGHLEYWECGGNQLVRWKDTGYQAVFDLLTKKIPDPNQELPVRNKTLLNKEVTKITWNKTPVDNSSDVTIECLDGSIYKADHVIVTVPLGVLKERAASMFVPSLPKDKLDCIKGLGFGTVDKIFLEFDEPWWKDDTDGFGFLWTKEDKEKDTSGWLTDVFYFAGEKYQPNVLLGWIIGPPARRMETLSDQEVMDGCMSLLRRFLKSKYPNIPQPKNVLKSTWSSNPHFRGSYSCRYVETEQMHVYSTQFQVPVYNSNNKPVILFAGEATHEHYFSTVHGAVETGWREANRLLSTISNLGHRKKSHYEVAIIGAGICGLSAAKTLHDHGVSDVIILESQPRPGGRIQTVKYNEDHFELGAQWIHGSKNDVFEISQRNGLLSGKISEEGQGLYLREDGTMIDDALVKEVGDVVRDILDYCESYKSCSDPLMRDSIGKELSEKFENYLNDTSDEDKLVKKELLNWHLRFQVIDNSCTDLNSLSAKAWGLYEFCGGTDYVNFTNGYSSLVKCLLDSLPKELLLLSTPVKKIEWSPDNLNGYLDNLKLDEKRKKDCNSLRIVCDDDLEFYSNYVIVTSSLGYLKANHKTMFVPPLPRFLTMAIDALGFDTIDKLFLVYEQPWWDANVKGLQLVWSIQKSEKFHWARDVTGFDVLASKQPALLGWVGGEGAKFIEKMSEEQVALEATEVLRHFLKNPSIPLPKKIIRSQWWLNEFVKGGYSHTTSKCDSLGIKASDLARPVMTNVYKDGNAFKKPTILLAGEASHASHFSTVHGAYESGEEQALVVLQHIQNKI